MVTLRCARCGNKWRSKSSEPKRCAYYPCRTMLWRGGKREFYSTHGLSSSPTYISWLNMKQRCLNKSNPRWASYGGCGIKMTGRWLRFTNFLTDMGERPKDKTLDRFPNPFGDYKKSNCRWATRSEQQNNMRVNRVIKYRGKRQSVACWANELKLNKSTLAKRLSRGWSIDEALGISVNGKVGRRKVAK